MCRKQPNSVAASARLNALGAIASNPDGYDLSLMNAIRYVKA